MAALPSANFDAEIDKIVSLYHAGELARAENLCRRLHKLQPKHPGALHLLGVIQHQAGDYVQAVDLIKQSIKLQPNADSCWCNLGLAHSALGRHEEAIYAYQRAISLNPLSAAAHLNLGMVLSAIGQITEAASYYDRAIQLKPDIPQAHFNLGNALWSLGQLFEAEHCYRRALALKPDFPEACLNLGNTLLDLDQVPAAIEYYQRTLALKADLPVAHYSLGNALRDTGQLDAAIGSFKRALALEPHYVDAILALGSALRATGARSEALAIYRQALSINPGIAEARINLNSVLSELGQPEEAGENLVDTLEQEPMLAEALSNLGNAALAAGQPDKAIAHFDRALAFKPGYAEILYNKSLALLLDGKLAEGWPLYEYRPARKNAAPNEYGCPLWEGQSLKGKRLLLVKEQGLGNQMQFLRYVPLLAALGAEVDVLLDPALLKLASTVPGVARVLAALPDNPDYDYWNFLLSMPLHLGTQLDSIPNGVPYLTAQPAAVSAWGADINAFAQGRRRVGLVWSGARTHINDRNRSIPLAAFAPLSEIESHCLVILQQDASVPALADVFRHTEVLLAGEQCKDFADTAAAIMNLDLVISVDTAVAHLAGALGRPVWTLIPCNRDGRWLLQRDDSPWYPSMRLYRQREYGQWDDVVARVAQDLSAGR